ncbi:MAG: hypothetical protein Q27BPR15_15205 [Rhodobacter sp. CACIA14H1]|nr:MAG: hypothetical protein Q27BPR15_15205 [Rhodobacter sp. CACIA14H1]
MVRGGFVLRHYGATDFITGLRAIAAMMVVCIHTGGFAGLGWIGQNVTEAGKYGVQVFFVISGFTIAATWYSGKGYGDFLVRRLARIAPTYWFVIAVAAALFHGGVIPAPHFLTEFGAAMGFYNLTMHLTFLSFLDYRIANSILGVEWTIPIEVFWYAALPLLLVRVNGWRGFLVWLLVLLVLAAVTRAALGAVANSAAAKWFPTTFGAYFLIGAACYHVRMAGWHRVSPWAGAAMWGSVGLFLAVLVLAPPGGGALIGLATAGLLVARRDSAGGGLWLDSVPLRFVGTVSYSVYLWHMPVVALIGDRVTDGLARYAMVAAVTIVLSTLTYLALERPTNRWGRRMAARVTA